MSGDAQPGAALLANMAGQRLASAGQSVSAVAEAGPSLGVRLVSSLREP
jgi:hypothetical protein